MDEEEEKERDQLDESIFCELKKWNVESNHNLLATAPTPVKTETPFKKKNSVNYGTMKTPVSK